MRKKVTKPDKRKVKSKEIIIDGIKFRSNLEGTMYNLLKEAGIKADYEKRKYVIIKPFTYNADVYERMGKSKIMVNRNKIRTMTYVPDFTCPEEKWIIEVKGRANESFPLRFKMFKDVVNRREQPPHLFVPGTIEQCKQVITILKEKGF